MPFKPVYCTFQGREKFKITFKMNFVEANSEFSSLTSWTITWMKNKQFHYVSRSQIKSVFEKEKLEYLFFSIHNPILLSFCTNSK